MRRYFVPIVAALAFLVMAGCPKRAADTIDVDAIQGRVDTVERELAAAEKELEAKRPDEAADHIERAERIMQEHREQLEAYPETEELRMNLETMHNRLCLVRVELAIGEFNHALKSNNLEAARESAERLERVFGECRPRLEKSEGYEALRIAMEQVPHDIKRLEAKLEQKRLRRQQDERLAGLGSKLSELEAALASLEKKPVGDARKKLKAKVDDFSRILAGEKERWKDDRWRGEIAKLEKRLQAVSDGISALGGKQAIIELVDKTVSKAAEWTVTASRTKDRRKALDLVQKAAQAYGECLRRLGGLLRKNKRLARVRFRWRSSTRDAVWLRNHCSINLKITTRMLKRLGGKKVAPSAGGSSQKEKKTSGGNKKSKRRGRIRRW